MERNDKASTLERLIPEQVEDGDVTGRETLLLHYERYEFAASYIPDGSKVLDIACGVGYGTYLMAEVSGQATEFVGVDVSTESIAYAKEKYNKPNIEFTACDAMNYHKPDYFDVIVSLETIEHLPAPNDFLTSIMRSLKSGGLFIGSVPITPSVDANPHHLHDFTATSFRTMLLQSQLSEVASFAQKQPFNPLEIARGKEKRLSDMRSNLLGYYIENPSALFKRIRSTLVDGFNNKYLTIVARKA